PKGQIIELPRGATVVDFAYAIHTEVGNSCVAATIDRRFAPLSSELTNGQTVTITTTPNGRPNPAWFNFVKTSKARSSIRYYLKRRHHTEVISLGKELLSKALISLSLPLDKISKQIINILLKEAKVDSIEALYEDIGFGNRAAIFVAHQLSDITNRTNFTTQKTTEQEEKPLLIKGSEGMAVTFASCCYPIPGDTIVGCFVPGHGLVIHTDACKRIEKLRKLPEKCILVRWADNVKGEFPITIKVEISSKRGSFAVLSAAISEAESNIDDITITRRTADNSLLTLRITVRNRDHLQRVLQFVETTPIVIRAWRV
ncbi:MAG: bifunctional (p)ppGpp synthetase/guanosine-3',5'-bis(diphosphate) 3'-pyrophosphohydrolase, partial [Gammaproteobacteria bacterium]|nr:bifunctional (p)ppGpp synthetase/guanosine-3',5'-bis(diphosphate) 3'-pyrophosphohydrolase [Gammaproteobacteria bacterium]